MLSWEGRAGGEELEAATKRPMEKETRRAKITSRWPCEGERVPNAIGYSYVCQVHASGPWILERGKRKIRVGKPDR